MRNTVALLFLQILVFILLWHQNLNTMAWKKYKAKYSIIRTNRPKLPRPRPEHDSDSGENPFQPRVIGGRPALWGEAPYHLRLTKHKGFACGASLLNYRGLSYAVTAAHCLWEGHKNKTHIEASSFDPMKIDLVGADLDFSQGSPREQWLGVVWVIIHPDFDPRWLANDIGLLFLDRYVFESVGLQHVPLPGLHWLDPLYVTITGHGGKLRLEANPVLQILELQVLEREICQAYIKINNDFGMDGDLRPTQMCMEHPDDWVQKGTCSGDSGGPAVAYNYSTRTWYLAGVHSWSSLKSCGSKNALSILTKVSHFVPWILYHADAWLTKYGTGNPYTNGTPED